MSAACLAACHHASNEASSSGVDAGAAASGATKDGDAATTDAAQTDTVVRPNDIFAAPARYVHQVVTVEIVEPLYKENEWDPSRDGLDAELTVGVPDGEGNRLVLVPSTYRIGDQANNRKSTFDHKLHSPIRIRGEILSDPDRANVEHAPGFYELRVLGETPITLPAPTPLDLAEAHRHPADWDRRYVTYQGILTEQFENVSIDNDIWFQPAPDVQKIGTPLAEYGTKPVRVTGIFYSLPGHVYGHMGMTPFQIIASRVEYLGDGGSK